MKFRNLIFYYLTAALFLISCTEKHHSSEITVSAGGNFTDVIKECANVYESDHPGTKVIVNIGSAGVLASQIIAGAPADIFFSTTEKHADMVIDKGFGLKETQRYFISNRIIAVYRKGMSFDLKSPDALLHEDVKKIALGNPETMSAGIAAQESLEFHGLYESVKPKAVYGETVRQVLDYVKKGEADAGIVFYTDYLIAKESVEKGYVFGNDSHSPIKYPVFVVKGTKNLEISKDFIDFLVSEKGLEIFKKFGYVTEI